MSKMSKTDDQDKRFKALRVFVVGYLYGRSSLGNHDEAGREAEAAFNRWWMEIGINQ